MDESIAVQSLAALAQASRLAVFRHLVALGHEGAFAGEIAGHLDIPANTLSFHLKTLAQAGLVSAEPAGRHVRYRANLDRMQALIGFLGDHCCGGQPELCAPVSSSACPPQPRRARR